MLRKFVALGVVGLLVAISFVVAENSIGSYNPIADVNRDGIVDILDLTEVGQAYGSTGLFYQPNQTIIAVYNETGPIENARVAVFGGEEPEQIGYTDSSGTVTFSIGSGIYTAIAWKGASFNYADFSPNSFGEASVLILINAMQKRLPYEWTVVTILNKTTGELFDVAEEVGVVFPLDELLYDEEENFLLKAYWYNGLPIGSTTSGIWRKVNVHHYIEQWDQKYGKPYFPLVLIVDRSGWYYPFDGFAVFSYDENYSANIVIYV